MSLSISTRYVSAFRLTSAFYSSSNQPFRLPVILFFISIFFKKKKNALIQKNCTYFPASYLPPTILFNVTQFFFYKPSLDNIAFNSRKKDEHFGRLFFIFYFLMIITIIGITTAAAVLLL